MPLQPSPPVKKLVVLEEGLLLSMANSQQFLQEFPFLKSVQSAAPKKAGCGGCGRGMNSQRAGQFANAKAALVSMGDDRKRKLKQLLNAKQVRITVRQGSRIVQHTF